MYKQLLYIQEFIYLREMEIIQYQGTSFESIAKGALGIIILLLIAYLISSNKKQIKWKTVLMALSLQIITAIGVIKINLIKRMFEIIGNFFIRILEFTEAGTSMVLGDLNIEKHEASFALQVLPVIIFFSAFASILYYFGVIQKLVSIMAWIFTSIGTAAFCYWMIQLKKFDDNNEEDKTITAHDYL